MKGKKILVSGNIRGVGKELVLKLAEEGAQIVAFCAPDSDIEDIYANVFVYKVIFNDADALCGNFERGLMVYGDFDWIINVAIVDTYKPLADMETYTYGELLNNNLRSQFVLAREFARLCRETPHVGGKVLNIICSSCPVPSSGAEAYYSIKGGTEALTQALAGSFSEMGVTANCITAENVDSFADNNYADIVEACMLVLSSDAIINGQSMSINR